MAYYTAQDPSARNALFANCIAEAMINSIHVIPNNFFAINAEGNVRSNCVRTASAQEKS